jgi:hypothetical protein
MGPRDDESMTTTSPLAKPFHPASRPSTVRVFGALQVPLTAAPTIPRHAPSPAPMNHVEPLPAQTSAQRLHPSGRYRSAVRLHLVS